jgi:hypothetical protein
VSVLRFAWALPLAWVAPALGQQIVTGSTTIPASLPALTPVSIEVLAALGSKTSKTGDTFPIRLAAPIMLDGKEAIPAGAAGLGEVVHAKKSGGMGAAGELVLAARYLEVGDRKLRLRSLRLVPQGKSAINRVGGFNAASAASPLPIGLIGFFIQGGQAAVPPGTIAEAKTAEAFVLEARAPASPAMPNSNAVTNPSQGAPK